MATNINPSNIVWEPYQMGEEFDPDLCPRCGARENCAVVLIHNGELPAGVKRPAKFNDEERQAVIRRFQSSWLLRALGFTDN